MMDEHIHQREEFDVSGFTRGGFARALGNRTEFAVLRRQEREQTIRFPKILSSEHDSICAKNTIGHELVLSSFSLPFS
jgi:hypothetical protein